MDARLGAQAFIPICSGLVIGWLTTTFPLLAFGIVLTVGYFSLRSPEHSLRDGAIILLGGLAILGHGFSNIGLTLAGVPIPLAETILLLVLVLYRPTTNPPVKITTMVASFTLWCGFRLQLDLTDHGTLALRDSIIAIDILALILGFRLALLSNARSARRFVLTVGSLVLLYSFTFPVWESLANSGPQVGFGEPIPLFGSTNGPAISVACMGLAAVLFLSGVTRIVLVTLVIAVLGVFQARSLYLLFPLTLLLVGLISRQSLRVAVSLVVSFVAALTMLLAFPAQIQGRIGAVTPEFLQANFLTLFGREGPSAATIEDRREWMGHTLEAIRKEPGSILLGVGFGDDLANGLRDEKGTLVRKPHNDYLEIFARLGLLGLVPFVGVIVRGFVGGLRALKRAQGLERAFVLWLLGASTIFVGVAAVQPLLSYPHGGLMLFTLLGFLLGRERIHCK